MFERFLSNAPRNGPPYKTLLALQTMDYADEIERTLDKRTTAELAAAEAASKKKTKRVVRLPSRGVGGDEWGRGREGERQEVLRGLTPPQRPPRILNLNQAVVHHTVVKKEALNKKAELSVVPEGPDAPRKSFFSTFGLDWQASKQLREDGGAFFFSSTFFFRHLHHHIMLPYFRSTPAPPSPLHPPSPRSTPTDADVAAGGRAGQDQGSPDDWRGERIRFGRRRAPVDRLRRAAGGPGLLQLRPRSLQGPALAPSSLFPGYRGDFVVRRPDKIDALPPSTIDNIGPGDDGASAQPGRRPQHAVAARHVCHDGCDGQCPAAAVAAAVIGCAAPRGAPQRGAAPIGRFGRQCRPWRRTSRFWRQRRLWRRTSRRGRCQRAAAAGLRARGPQKGGCPRAIDKGVRPLLFFRRSLVRQ